MLKMIQIWMEGIHAGFEACGFDHAVWVEATNGVWASGESYRIMFQPEIGTCRDAEERKNILDGIISSFRRTFDAKFGEYPTEVEPDDGIISAVVENVRGR